MKPNSQRTNNYALACIIVDIVDHHADDKSETGLIWKIEAELNKTLAVSETGTPKGPYPGYRVQVLEEADKECDRVRRNARAIAHGLPICEERSRWESHANGADECGYSIRALKETAPQVAQAARPEAAEAARTPVGAATPNTHAEAWAHRSGLMEGALSRLLTALVTHPSPDIHNAVDNAKEILKTPQVGDDQRNAPWSSHGSAAMWHNRDGRTVEPVGNDLIGGKGRWAA